MAAGYPIVKVDLDNRMGQAVLAVRQSLVEIVRIKAMLDDTTILPDATLTSLGYSPGEITQLRAAFADLKKLYDISTAAAVQTPANDFWFNAKHLTGLN